MNWFTRMPLMRQVQFAFAFYGALIAASAFFGWKLRLEVETYSTKVERASSFLLDIQRFSEERYHLHSSALRHFNQRSGPTLEKFLEHENDIVQRLNDVLASANENRWLLDQEMESALRNIQLGLPRLLQSATAQLLELGRPGAKVDLASVDAIFLSDSEFDRDVERLLEGERADVGQLQADLASAVARYRKLIILTLILGVFVLPMIFILLRRTVIRPMNELVIAATALAKVRDLYDVGCLLRRICERDDIDPSIRGLAVHLESIRRNLDVTVAKVHAVAQDDLDDPILEVDSPGDLGERFRSLVNYLQSLASHAELLARGAPNATRLNKGVLGKAIQRLASKEDSLSGESKDDAA